MDVLLPHDMTNITATRTEKRILPVPGEDYWVLHLMAELRGVESVSCNFCRGRGARTAQARRLITDGATEHPDVIEQ